jgi:hypothetical protein
MDLLSYPSGKRVDYRTGRTRQKLLAVGVGVLVNTSIPPASVELVAWGSQLSGATLTERSSA